MKLREGQFVDRCAFVTIDQVVDPTQSQVMRSVRVGTGKGFLVDNAEGHSAAQELKDNDVILRIGDTPTNYLDEKEVFGSLIYFNISILNFVFKFV